MKYFIITMSKNHHEITQEQKESLMRVDASQVELSDGSIVKINSISEILPEEKYYQTFPDKRPTETRNDFEEKYSQYSRSGSDQIRKPTKRARELMLEGMKKYIGENPGNNKNALEMYNKFMEAYGTNN